jgi:hypothetical protein
MAMGNNVGQVDHVVMMCRPENLAGATERLSKMLEIEFDYFEAPRQGIKGALSIGSGLEYIAPLCDGSAMSDSLLRLLDEKGEGVHSITFGVANAEKTKARLDREGFKSREPYDAINEDAADFMHEKFSVTKEVHLRERIAGTLFVLSEITTLDDG